MLPFALKVAFLRVYMFFLKIGTMILPFKWPAVHSGPGSSLQLCETIAADGVKSLMIVTDAMLVEIGLLKDIEAKLKELGISYTIYDGVKPDPTIEQIETGLKILEENNCEAILAVGGGSSIDAAKVIAARKTNKKPIQKMAGLFRVFRKIHPLYAIPTTAGTGSEVTIAAVVSDPENQRKFPIMDLHLLPIKTALDGQLMAGLPPAITAATGMDALTHAVEAYISNNAWGATDEKAIEATQLVMENLPEAFNNGSNLEARQNMAQASHLAGIAFTQAGVGYVHAIAHNFGAYYHVPHGLANAIVMPHVLDYSKPKCADRLADLARACNIGNSDDSDEVLADKFIERIREMNATFGIPTKLDKLQTKDIPAIADAALKEARFTYAVPRYMDHPTCENLIKQMLV